MSPSSRIEEFRSWIVVTFQDCTVSDGFFRQLPIDVVICAYREAGIVFCLNVRSFAHRQIGQVYQGIRLRKGHQKAVGSAARRLAEAAYGILSKAEPHR